MRPSSGNNTVKSFKDVQHQFTRHMRDPDNEPAPADVEDRRMAIYRDLLYRSVEGLLANSFPVLRKILRDDEWHPLIRHYFKNHLSRTPLFPKMPREFLRYLQDEREVDDGLYPFVRELAHYEWIETALAIDSREIREGGIDETGDLLAGIPVLNELAWPLVYAYPVHRISPDYLPMEKPEQPTYLLVYRNRRHDVGFIELNPVAARLIDCLQDSKSKTGKEILMNIADELAHPDPEVVINGGRDILEGMRKKQIILGVEQAVSPRAPSGF